MTPAEAIRRLTTVADMRAWFSKHGETLTSAEHVIFGNRFAALVKNSGDSGPPPVGIEPGRCVASDPGTPTNGERT